jgi:hypothetical protein
MANVCRCGAVTVELPPLVAPVDQLWHVLLDLGGELTVPWTLVGGQMVLLHTLERGQVPPISARTVTWWRTSVHPRAIVLVVSVTR